MRKYINEIFIVVGIFGITYGQSGNEWHHWGCFVSGIVIVSLFGLRLLD